MASGWPWFVQPLQKQKVPHELRNMAIPTARRPHALDIGTEKSIRPTKARRRRRSTMVIEALKAARDFIENDRQALAESLTVKGEIVFEDDIDRGAMAEYVKVLAVIDEALNAPQADDDGLGFARAVLGAARPAPNDIELMGCWVEKPDGTIDGIASMRLALSKYGTAAQRTGQEPVAWRLWDDEPGQDSRWQYYDKSDFKDGVNPMGVFTQLVALYTTPPAAQRQWVGSGDLEDSNAYLTPPAQPAAKTGDPFLQGVCVALQAVTGSGDGVLWREIVEAAGADELFQYAAHIEPEEWELAGFAVFAKSEMRRDKPKKPTCRNTPAAAQRAPVPDFKAFKEWAANDGYDVAYTHDGIKWVCLNPMTADLWKAWQAATPAAAQPATEESSAVAAPVQEPASVREKWLQAVTDKIEAELLSHRLSLHDEVDNVGTGFPLVDALCCGQSDLEIGRKEVKDIAEAVYHVLDASTPPAAAQPAVPLTDGVTVPLAVLEAAEASLKGGAV
jgi:hypothetical protein